MTQAGFVNNLNDEMAWGLFPILFASYGLTFEKIGWLAAISSATRGLFQLWTEYASDCWGRKGIIVWGMWMQAYWYSSQDVLTAIFSDSQWVAFYSE